MPKPYVGAEVAEAFIGIPAYLQCALRLFTWQTTDCNSNNYFLGKILFGVNNSDIP